jgi:hypothetical protein
MKSDAIQKFFELILPFPATAERVMWVMAKSGHDDITNNTLLLDKFRKNQFVHLFPLKAALRTLGLAAEGFTFYNTFAKL